MMASPKYQSNALRSVASVILIFTLISLPSKSVGEAFTQKKLVLGSRPPMCINRCLSCRPCKATLVIPPSPRKRSSTFRASSYHQDDTYYLLSWKCRCGNKIYQP
ncbi:hypothetical protein GIB67_017804 [Kingdonia uniflora]|uniref:Epidermal patterning factor-like protein n=1 Tax=Kingdonia uniflora TaxID=39325 RepID=A0A7J7MPN0_9MAGN|nr:hypothetical protein GIB67_017804 [Kingdonia uniflora]